MSIPGHIETKPSSNRPPSTITCHDRPRRSPPGSRRSAPATFRSFGAVDDAGTLLAFRKLGTFRGFFPPTSTRWSTAVYVHHAHRGRGLGKLLMRELIRRARLAEVHLFSSAASTPAMKAASACTSDSIQPLRDFNQVGFQFGRWLDAAFYQLHWTLPRSRRMVESRPQTDIVFTESPCPRDSALPCGP